MPSISLDMIRQRSASLQQGMDSIAKGITEVEGHLTKLRNDLTATSGAKQILDILIKESEAAPAATA